ncbi:MAG: DUF4231 domain-containing protein [Cyanobium sp.]
MDAETYIADRVDRQLTWLSNSSKKNKQRYLRYRICGILLGSLVTVLAPYAGQNAPYSHWVPPILQLSGAGIAVVGSLLALNRHQENWLRYRLLKETLEREKLLYLTGSLEAYTGPEAFHVFVRRAEAIMAEERVSWVSQAAERVQGAERSFKAEVDPRTESAQAEDSSPQAQP